MYELFWAAPDRFRETLQLNKLSEEHLAAGNKMYVSRNTPTLALQISHIGGFIHHPLSHFLGDLSTAHKVYSASVGGEILYCIATSAKTDDRLCLDPTTNQVVSVSVKSVPPSTPYDLEQDGFVSVGPRRYPGRMTGRLNFETIEVRVEVFAGVTAFAPDVFVPAANAVVRDWCLHPVPKPGYYFSTRPFPKTDPPGVFYPFYLLIGKDGHIKNFFSLNRSAPAVDPSVAKWIREAEFPICVCGSTALEGERIVTHEW